MKKSTIKFVTVLAVTALITACSVFSPALADAGFVPVQESAGSGGENLMLPEEETSFNGEVAAVIVAALVLCGVVIVVVNNRSKRK